MQKRKILFLIKFICCLNIHGQIFKGKIIDSKNKIPLAGCSVFLPDFHTGTSSNDQGEFQINESASDIVVIQISLIGYKPLLASLSKSDTFRIFELEQTHLQIQEVVISAPKGKLQNDNIVLIERKDIKELKSTGASSLADALSMISGVDQLSTGIGIGKPIIRGLTGNRIVTYAQEVRQENQQWGDEHGLAIGDLGIEAVEVIKGPSSLLYGSDALGGVLYFVEERYAKEDAIESYIQTGFQSNNQLGNGIGALKINKNKFKINLFGGYNNATNYQMPTQKRVNNTIYNEANFKTAIGYSKHNWTSNLRYSFLRNNFGITEDSSVTESTTRNVELPFQKVDMHSISNSNTFFYKRSTLNLVLGYSHNNRKEFEDIQNTAALAMALNTVSYNLKWSRNINNDKTSTIVGMQGMIQKNNNNAEEYLIPNANTRDMGLYGLVHHKITNWNLQAGARFDYRKINGEAYFEDTLQKFKEFNRNFINPNFSFGAVYKKNSLTVRINCANGFRSPNLSELSSNGVHEGTNRYEIGNQSLKIENALQGDLSLDYTNEHFQFGVNPFVNRIFNYIYLAPTALIIEEKPVFNFLQTNATLYGGELGIHYHPHLLHWLHIESNVSTVMAQDDAKQPLPLIPATRINTTVKAEFKGALKELFLNSTYKFSQNRVSIFETPTQDYYVMNAGVNLDFKLRNNPMAILLVVRNLANQKYVDHLSRLKYLGFYNQGINICLNVKINLTPDKLNN